MAIVNSRPLTVNNLYDPLTPNHLLTMKSVTTLPPPGKYIEEDMHARKRWHQIQFLAGQFWSCWRKEYLSNIAVRQRWHDPRRNLKVDDIVLERSDDLPRNEWRLGRVTEATVSKDGLVRKVKLCVGDRNQEWTLQQGYCNRAPSPKTGFTAGSFLKSTLSIFCSCLKLIVPSSNSYISKCVYAHCFI